MSSAYTDQLLKDDDGYVIRQLVQRISSLEKIVSALAPTGVVVNWPGDLRGNFWSSNRAESVGSQWSRWYRFDDPITSDVFEDAGGSPSNRPTLVGTPEPVRGQPGGLVSEGSYSAYFNSTAYMTYPSVALGQRNWTIEAIFSPVILPADDKIILAAGQTGTGPQFRISGATGGSGQKLTIYLDGAATRVDTGIALIAGRWYHAIAVADPTTALNWYVGEFNPVTRGFTYAGGGTTMASPPVASTGLGSFGNFDGYLGDALIYGGEINWVEAADRIYCSFQTAAPEGWLAADGAAVSRNDYSRLFSRIGITNGAGDGSTTFNLPNQSGAIVKT